MLDSYIKQLDLCYFELGEAFKGLADEHVWKRPAPDLLSIGELAGHIAYWETVRFAGDSEDGRALRDLSNCKLSSPLLDARFGYYTTNLEALPTHEQSAMSAEQVFNELTRIHREAVEYLRITVTDLQAKAPYWGSNYEELLRYMPFHAAYHTGQIYSVRHLLGETTPDN